MKNIAKILSILLRTTNPVATNTINEKSADVGVDVDGILCKDGVIEVPAVPEHDHTKHTDRTRRIFIPVTYGERGIVLTGDGVFVGADLLDNNLEAGLGVFTVPLDYVSDGILKGIVVSDASGDLAYVVSCSFGTDGEATNQHSVNTGVIIEAVVLDKIEILSTGVSLTNLAVGDVMSCSVMRNGAHAEDTIADTVYAIGFIFEETADM